MREMLDEAEIDVEKMIDSYMLIASLIRMEA